MITLRSFLTFPLLTTLLLTAPLAQAQHKKAASTAKTTSTAAKSKEKQPIVSESLSGLDLIPNRRTGQFAVRISQRISQPATLRLIDTKTSRIIRTELLEPSAALTRAIQVGKLPNGEYKMEVVIPDTVYWKTVRVTR